MIRFVAGGAVLLSLGGLLVGLVAGCEAEGGHSDSGQEMTIVVEADTEKIRAQEKALAEKAQQLQSERDRLMAERQKLLEKLGEGKVSKAIIEQQKLLLERERELRAREKEMRRLQAELDAQRDRLLGAGVPAAGGTGSAAGAREAELAAREKRIAAREADLARREKALAEREARVAERELALANQQIAAVGAAVTVPSEPGRKGSRKVAERLHKQARAAMRRRGLLPGDLPPEAASLERRYYEFAAAGRWAQAEDAARDFGAAVEAVAIDEAFIQDKMSRLNALRAKKKLTKAQEASVRQLMSAATRAFADGRHEEANRSLNRIYALFQS